MLLRVGVGGSGLDIPVVKARLTACRHRALVATLVARRLAPTPADRAALDEQLGLLHFDQVPEAGSGCFELQSRTHT